MTIYGQRGPFKKSKIILYIFLFLLLFLFPTPLRCVRMSITSPTVIIEGYIYAAYGHLIIAFFFRVIINLVSPKLPKMPLLWRWSVLDALNQYSMWSGHGPMWTLFAICFMTYPCNHKHFLTISTDWPLSWKMFEKQILVEHG